MCYLGTRVQHEVGIEKEKSEVLPSPERVRRYPSFEFAREGTDTVTKARYLRVTITTTEVLEESAIMRIQNAHDMDPIEAGKVAYRGMDAKYALVVFRSRKFPISIGANGNRGIQQSDITILRKCSWSEGQSLTTTSHTCNFDLDSIRLLRSAMTNRFCIRMKEQCKDESDGEQRPQTQTMNTLRDSLALIN